MKLLWVLESFTFDSTYLNSEFDCYDCAELDPGSNFVYIISCSIKYAVNSSKTIVLLEVFLQRKNKSTNYWMKSSLSDILESLKAIFIISINSSTVTD